MDDQALIRSYGNTDLPEGTPDRPLVTFAVFAFNQEKYIREAVEGAFSQTYSPLEIILSDDCSSDGTFAIMEEMARGYVGPHRVVVTRGSKNAGILNHILSVNEIANGNLIVVAAGDDVSIADRAVEIMSLWKKEKHNVVYSLFDRITESGQLTAIDCHTRGSDEVISWLPTGNQPIFCHGATAAYAKTFLDRFPKSKRPVNFEDGVFYLFLALTGDAPKRIEKSLVKYRQNNSAISNSLDDRTNIESIRNRELRASMLSKYYDAFCEYCEQLTLSIGNHNSSVIANIASTRRFASIRTNWIDGGLIHRIKVLTHCRSLRELRFMAPRMMGLGIFATIKFLLSPKKS